MGAVGAWTWALRYANRDGVPIVTEQRVIPTEEAAARSATPWKWSRDTDAVPNNGLPFTSIHNLPFGRIDQSVRQALANYDHPMWPGRRDVPDDDLPDHYLEWLDVTSRSGIDRNSTASPQRPGRPALSEEHLAEVALHYTTALADRTPTTRYIEEQMQEGVEYLPVAQWVAKARKRGYLTEPPTKGRPGGLLTDKAEAVIAKHGLTSPRNKATERSRQ